MRPNQRDGKIDSEYVLLASASDLLPVPVSISTLHRWRTAGVILGDGSRLKLQCLKTGGRWSTSRRWISEFIAAQNAGQTMVESGQKRREQLDFVEAELRRFGV